MGPALAPLVKRGKKLLTFHLMMSTSNLYISFCWILINCDITTSPSPPSIFNSVFVQINILFKMYIYPKANKKAEKTLILTKTNLVYTSTANEAIAFQISQSKHTTFSKASYSCSLPQGKYNGKKFIQALQALFFIFLFTTARQQLTKYSQVRSVCQNKQK